MRVAIIGSGIAGLATAHLLYRDHEITLFESDSRVGGHVHTVEIESKHGMINIDTGFIVYNEQNYPNFVKLIQELDIQTQPSSMSFSVRLANPDLEYNGSTLRQLFVDKRNLFRPWFYKMLRDILRFNRMAPDAIDGRPTNWSLRELLNEHGFGQPFIEYYLVPMGAAIWSTPVTQVLDIPARFFIQFFENHGMLTVDDRPEWRVIKGGSCQYVKEIIKPFADRIRLNHTVRQVERFPDHVTVDGERFDEVVFACHSDQALEILKDPSPAERSVLGAIPYQANEVVLHTDTSLLPRRRQTWAAWNYHSSGPLENNGPVALTYNMNILQALNVADTFCVTLNDSSSINDEDVLERFEYHHPLFTLEGIAAQKRHTEISGIAHTHYCGAYWGYGFHEDGLNSALAVARAFGVAV